MPVASSSVCSSAPVVEAELSSSQRSSSTVSLTQKCQQSTPCVSTGREKDSDRGMFIFYYIIPYTMSASVT